MRVWSGWPLVAVLVAGCASAAGDTVNGDSCPHGLDSSFAHGVMGCDELYELQSRPAPERRRRLDQLLTSHPDDHAARFLRVQAEMDLHDNPAALADSDLILASPSLESNLRRWTLEIRAESLIPLDRFDEAIASASQALEIDGSSSAALISRGWARLRANQKDAALADLDRALQSDSNDSIGFYRRARVLEDQGMFDRAAKDFKRAIELTPDDVDSRLGYALLLYRTGHLEPALAQFDADSRLMPNEPMFLIWHGQTNFALKRFDAAAADEKRVNALNVAKDDLFDAHHDVAVDLAKLEDFDGAAREYKRALALKPDPHVAMILARMQAFSGQFAQAVDAIREAGMSPALEYYRSIWLFVVRGRANPADEPAAKAELASLTQPHQPHAWTDTLVGLLLGKTTLEAALAEADAAETYKLKAGRRCEADYYAAEQFLMHRQEAPASRLLEEAYWVCPSTYFEANAVLAERRLIESKSLAH